MKKIIGLLLLCTVVLTVWFTCSNCRAIKRNVVSKPVTHEIWDALLKKHVAADGFVHYKGFIQDSAELNRYLRVLESAHPSEQGWTRAEQMAYWINAYNAYTVQLIVRNYPVESIKDIRRGLAFVNSVWDIKFIKIQGFTYDLNNIEHNILRPVFKDARIHAAINCASYSCPRLRNEAYTAENLEKQLDDGMRGFVNDPLRNQLSGEKARVSEIFKWFRSDFERDAGSLRAYLNRYAATPLRETTDISFLDYQWSLNEAK
ncbi:MAG: DUF547 domain-containing protein [Saprospiraceae bacterium]|nr:DUF547 domain-containing protein [Saprospiraceae bacterium]